MQVFLSLLSTKTSKEIIQTLARDEKKTVSTRNSVNFSYPTSFLFCFCSRYSPSRLRPSFTLFQPQSCSSTITSPCLLPVITEFLVMKFNFLLSALHARKRRVNVCIISFVYLPIVSARPSPSKPTNGRPTPAEIIHKQLPYQLGRRKEEVQKLREGREVTGRESQFVEVTCIHRLFNLETSLMCW